MSYLTYHPYRRETWTEFERFPHKAVKYWRDSSQQWNKKYGTVPLRIYTVSDDQTEITLIPEEEWPSE
jgi:hypothetical protein